MPLPHRTKVAIIGSGPAGYTAAIYAARANLEPVLFEGGGAAIEPITLPGGQLMITTEVENYPGFPEGIHGPGADGAVPEAGGALRHHQRAPATSPRSISATARSASCRPRASWSADTLIIATGASAKWLGIPSEQTFKNRGVSACATCDGALFKGKDVLVVGGGDTAMEEATFLTRFATKVTVVHRRDEFRASKIMQERARSNPKIELVSNSVIEEILGELPRPGVTGVRLRDTRDGRRASCRSAACSSPSATSRTRSCSGAAGHGRRRLPQGASRARRRPTSPACSPCGDVPTTSTARRSPPPAPAAWPPSTPSASSGNNRRIMSEPPTQPEGGSDDDVEPEFELTEASEVGGVPIAADVAVSEPAAIPARSTIPPEKAVELLSKINLFSALQPPTCAASPTSASKRSTTLSDMIFKEGAQGDKFYLILSGAVRISRTVPGMGEEALAVLRAGTHFGEMALIDDFPRSADARAHETCRLFVVRKEDIEDLLFVDRDLAYELLWTFVRTLSARLRETNDKMTFMSVTPSSDPSLSAARPASQNQPVA